jgi:2'-5' RNA ligase
MAVKRLFIALTCTDAERAELARDQAALLARVRKAHPTAAGNFHLTLAFLGMQDEDGERAAAEAVAAAARTCEPVPLALGPLGTFHHRHGGDVVWRGVAATPELNRLQRTLVRELAQRGIELEARPFIGHITLARSVRANKDDDLDRLCAELTSQLSGQPAGGSSGRLSGQPAGGSSGRLSGQPAGELSDHLAGRPASELTSRPASEPSGPLSSRPAIESLDLCDPASSGSASDPRPPATLHTGVSLMWSHRPEGGALTYTPIATFALDGAAAS